MSIFFLLLFSIIPLNEPIVDQVDLIEINKVYNIEGKVTLSQAIYYNWSENDGRHQVVDWRFVKSEDCLIIKDWNTDRHKQIFKDGKYIRKIISKRFIKSESIKDPEAEERNYLPTIERKRLSSPVKYGTIKRNN